MDAKVLEELKSAAETVLHAFVKDSSGIELEYPREAIDLEAARKIAESLPALIAAAERNVQLERLREAVASFDKSWGTGGMPGAVERFHHWQEVQAALASIPATDGEEPATEKRYTYEEFLKKFTPQEPEDTSRLSPEEIGIRIAKEVMAKVFPPKLKDGEGSK